jgi:Rne/Rng family ribonuclease
LLAAQHPLLELLCSGGESITEIICDSRASAAELEKLAHTLDAALAARVHYRPRRDWVPAVAELEEQIDEALSDEVALPSGALLNFEETRAMTVVDVDSGTARLEGVGAKAERSFLRVNLEAVGEIARQLRLRNFGGMTVIDFINMQSRQLRQEVIDAMRSAVADDPHPVWIGSMSKLGVLELTRQRRGPTLASQLLRDCSTCGGRHRVVRDELRPWIGSGI